MAVLAAVCLILARRKKNGNNGTFKELTMSPTERVILIYDIDKETLKTIAILIAPFAPHVAEEFYHMLGGNGTVFAAGWPTFDEKHAKADTIKLPIQINGKTRGFVDVGVEAAEKDVLAAAKEVVKDKLTGTIIKEIYVKGKIINFVIK